MKIGSKFFSTTDRPPTPPPIPHASGQTLGSHGCPMGSVGAIRDFACGHGNDFPRPVRLAIARSRFCGSSIAFGAELLRALTLRDGFSLRSRSSSSRRTAAALSASVANRSRSTAANLRNVSPSMMNSGTPRDCPSRRTDSRIRWPHSWRGHRVERRHAGRRRIAITQRS